MNKYIETINSKLDLIVENLSNNKSQEYDQYLDFVDEFSDEQILNELKISCEKTLKMVSFLIENEDDDETFDLTFSVVNNHIKKAIYEATKVLNFLASKLVVEAKQPEDADDINL